MWRDPRFHGMDLFRAELTDYAYSRHFHDTYVVAVGRNTGYRFNCERGSYTAPPGTIVLINPGEVHDGRSVDGRALSYRSMYPTRELFAEVARAIGRRFEPIFPKRVIDDPSLADLLSRAHAGLEQSPRSLAAQELLIQALTILVNRHAEAADRDPALHDHPAAVSRARAFLEDHVTEAVSLDDLSDASEISPFHLLRIFHATLGLPPHQYLLNLRIQRAQTRLARGESIAQVALECGFSDQSHLNRCFKRVLGITPGRYRSNFVQDGRSTSS
jgi:AraC-like DNA-binding protein